MSNSNSQHSSHSNHLPGCERAEYATSCFTRVAPPCGRAGFTTAGDRGCEFVVCLHCAKDCIREDVTVHASDCTDCGALVANDGPSEDDDVTLCKACIDARIA
jgi:hypothetical protein